MIYEPREDSFLLAKYVKKYAKGKVLDIGSGSGIQAETALQKTKDVIATDIDEEAIKLLNKKNIKVIKSNLFENIKDKFDLIIFNPPYLPGKKDKTIQGGKNGYETLERFLTQLSSYLKDEGKALIVFSSLTNKDKVDKIIIKNNLRFTPLAQENIFFEKLYVYLIQKNL